MNCTTTRDTTGNVTGITCTRGPAPTVDAARRAEVAEWFAARGVTDDSLPTTRPMKAGDEIALTIAGRDAGRLTDGPLTPAACETYRRITAVLDPADLPRAASAWCRGNVAATAARYAAGE